ncbi:hypothetical protein [Streptomyces sp. NPDC002490]|uniref:hypothetical protein n=1 Tax=Streptomyces sp. NPDC002490 TaxID=3154416 RepID=UPI00331769D3
MTTTPATGSDAVAEADRRFRLWMRQNLDRAAARFGLTVTGEPVFGWRDRPISALVDSPDGAPEDGPTLQSRPTAAASSSPRGPTSRAR